MSARSSAVSRREPSSGTSKVMTSSETIIDNLTAAQFESLLLQMLDATNSNYGSPSVKSREAILSRMVSYCIRMLHSHGWVPQTVIRTMVLIEAGPKTDRSIKGFMYQAMRQRRDENRARRAIEGSNVDTNAWNMNGGMHDGDEGTGNASHDGGAPRGGNGGSNRGGRRSFGRGSGVVKRANDDGVTDVSGEVDVTTTAAVPATEEKAKVKTEVEAE